MNMKCSWLRLFTAICTVFSLQSAWAAEELIIYSGRSDKFVKPVVEAFTKETGIKVILHSAESTALLSKLRIEGDRTEADLFLSNDAGNLQIGSDLGLFLPLPETLVKPIPANWRASDNSWVGLSARARVLVVNTKNHKADFVKSVFDLADPRLKGRIGITNSTSESFIAGTTVYMLKAGKEKTKAWLDGLKNNAQGQVFPKHGSIVTEVASGRKDVGLVNHYYIFRHLKEHPKAPIRIVLPDQGKDGMGVAWNVAGIAITKHTAKAKLAERLVEFLASEKGQKMFAEANSEYPTRTGVPAAAAVPLAGSYKVADVPMSELGHQRNDTINLIEAAGMP